MRNTINNTFLQFLETDSPAILQISIRNNELEEKTDCGA